MSESDSGVDTGSESNESNSMSIESPPRLEEDKDVDDIAEAPNEPGVSHVQMGMPFANIQPVYCSYGYSDYRQHEHKPKMKRVSTHASMSKSRRELYSKPYDILGDRKLRSAVTSSSVPLVKAFLNLGIDPCVSDEKNRTPLHFAASLGHTEVARILLEHGANPNQRDVLGNTPLHLAACTSHIETVTLLLKAGTDVNAFNKSGRSPLHLAQSKLKLLQRSKSYSSSQLKAEVMHVLEMMQVYLQRSGQPSEVDILNAFSTRLQHHQTREEVNHDVSDLLSSLSHLSL